MLMDLLCLALCWTLPELHADVMRRLFSEWTL